MPLQFDTVKSFETAFQTTTFEKKKKRKKKKDNVMFLPVAVPEQEALRLYGHTGSTL